MFTVVTYNKVGFFDVCIYMCVYIYIYIYICILYFFYYLAFYFHAAYMNCNAKQINGFYMNCNTGYRLTRLTAVSVCDY